MPVFRTSSNYVGQTSLPSHNDSECRYCEGKLVVSNGHETDTIFGGQWGNVPNYKIEKIKNRELLILEYDYGFPLGEKIKLFQIISLSNEHFLEELFTRQIRLYLERLEHRIGDSKVSFVYRNSPTIELCDTLEITNNITYEICPSAEDVEDVEDYICNTIFKFTESEHFDLANLLGGN